MKKVKANPMASKYGKTNLRKHGSPFIRDNSKVKTVEDNGNEEERDLGREREELIGGETA